MLSAPRNRVAITHLRFPTGWQSGSSSKGVKPGQPPVIAGKTTLLNILAGQLPQNPRLTLSGVITVNGVPIDRSSHGQGYVQQEDIFYSQLTVKRVSQLICCQRVHERLMSLGQVTGRPLAVQA